MKLVCVGIGGTGAACVETVVHMAVLGMFESYQVVPMVLDPDQGHPRIVGFTNFLAGYAELRRRGQADDLFDTDLFGTRIVRETRLNAQRPAVQESLFSLLGLSSSHARPLFRLFFREDELGEPGSHEFANGYYGRANAGVCFFCDPSGKAAMMGLIREHLLGGDAALVVFGSIFGGTGAAGLLHVARTIREDPQLRNAAPRIAIVQLESYFEPDASRVDASAGFVNLPETFQRRTGAAYHFLSNLATNDNLPCDALYPLGVRRPAVLPPEWFRRDQQDNPHLFLEYLAALAARDFIVNLPEQGHPQVRVRRVPSASFGAPLDELRRRLHAAAYTYLILRDLVRPLIGRSDSTTVPGHPWIHDVVTECRAGVADLRDHFGRSQVLLRDVLGHSGVLEGTWRSERDDGQQRTDVSEQDRTRFALMAEKTRDSFPDEFVPHIERIDLPTVFRDGNPAAIFDSYRRSTDTGLPVRALYRWVGASMRLPSPPATQLAQVDYQLVQQEDILDQDSQALNLANIPDDAFRSVDAAAVLKKLARATWKSPPGTRRRQATEFPSVWSPALIHSHSLYSASTDPRSKYVQLGLLWAALMKWGNRFEVPVHEFSMADTHVSQGFRDAVLTTCPLANYHEAVMRNGNVLALYDPESNTARGEVPHESEILGFFYPDTVLVPAAWLSRDKVDRLYELGRFVSGRQFPVLMRAICSDWANVLRQSSVPNADDLGRRFEIFLESFNDTVGTEATTRDEMYQSFPYPDVAPWIRHLYAAQGVQSQGVTP